MKVSQKRTPKYSSLGYKQMQDLAVAPMPIFAKFGICRICFRELAYKGENSRC